MVLRPVGPLPPGAYWLRRLFLLLVVIVVVAFFWWLFHRGSGNDAGATDATPPVTESPSVTPTVTSTGTATSSPKATKTKSKSAKTAPCADRDIKVTVATNSRSYAADELPSFTLTIENVGDSACSRDVGPQALELRVSSGGSKIWSSDDCNPSTVTRVKDFNPGDRFVQAVQWDRDLSEPGCPTPQKPAPAGDYQVLARDLEVFSEPAPFVLQ